jgi:hypothetical protein
MRTSQHRRRMLLVQHKRGGFTERVGEGVAACQRSDKPLTQVMRITGFTLLCAGGGRHLQRDPSLGHTHFDVQGCHSFASFYSLRRSNFRDN